ncbi:predicted protein [Nematostella vectensis]|uniref:Tyrosinase copper-binding domain-containing protein n=1 Tax=Nematostella vectensis TaxID=45351 RepID=A7RQY2_NEMVE|nr:predicted protein [Nematostella vectensis]|eukprot:XP_001638312.1 predicted protein [Nematostella vectensis]
MVFAPTKTIQYMIHQQKQWKFLPSSLVQNAKKQKGLHVNCSSGVRVYDECMRRCKCTAEGNMVDCYRVRKDFESMSIPERRLYIQTLKKASSVEPYKSEYDRITKYHSDLFNQVHILEYFFPWHRWYLLLFENLLRKIDCRVTVPYWDWSRAVGAGRLWRGSYLHDVWSPGPHGIGGNGEGSKRIVTNGPLRKDSWELPAWHEQPWLSREFNDCYKERLPNSHEVRDLLCMPREKFVKFEDTVRDVMHNDFHNAIGGVMSLDASANAPEFWFHHGYIDKVWSDWQKRGKDFKYQYYHTVRSDLPGAGIHGTELVDLSGQPGKVKVVYDDPEPRPRDEEYDPSVPDARPIFLCDDDDDDDDDENHQKYHEKYYKKITIP